MFTLGCHDLTAQDITIEEKSLIEQPFVQFIKSLGEASAGEPGTDALQPFGRHLHGERFVAVLVTRKEEIEEQEEPRPVLKKEEPLK